MRVFVTSTPPELDAHRTAVCDVVRKMGHEVVLRDPGATVADGVRPAADADAVLALRRLASRTAPAPEDGGDGLRPWASWELDAAFVSGRSHDLSVPDRFRPWPLPRFAADAAVAASVFREAIEKTAPRRGRGRPTLSMALRGRWYRAPDISSTGASPRRARSWSRWASTTAPSSSSTTRRRKCWRSRAAACPERREAWALRERVPTRKCPSHLQADIDLETGLRLNPSCRGGRRYETRSFIVWPADVRRYLTAHHRVLTQPPSLLPGCEASGGGEAPRIVSPPPDQILVLLPGVATSDQEVPLRAEADVPGSLSWFVDGEFLGTVQGDEELWWTPLPGHHQFLVMDEAGRAARRLLKVRRAS